MHIDIICAVPDLLKGPFDHSIIKRAADRGLLSIDVVDLRKFGKGKHNQIDDCQYGGGAGMVLMPEPLYDAIELLKNQRKYNEVIYLTPDGSTFNQSLANSLSLAGNLLLICGHYKGIDERIREHCITLEISIGDYVLSGGELAAAVLVDSIGRLIPGVLNDGTSALFDSHQDKILAPPVYTRPAEFKGWRVPEILLSGNKAAIEHWRDEQAYHRTKERRPDLLED